MGHWINWVLLIILILAFTFFIISIITLEFGVKVDDDGDIVIPWYYWFFFAGMGVLFLVFVLLLVIVPRDKKDLVYRRGVIDVEDGDEVRRAKLERASEYMDDDEINFMKQQMRKDMQRNAPKDLYNRYLRSDRLTH